MELVDNHKCFVCGPDNPHGLHINFTHIPGQLKTNFKTEEWMQGYANIVHGGIISIVLDESMVKLLYLEGFKAVSAQLNIRLFKPVSPGTTLFVESHLTGQKGRILKTQAQATLEDGTLIASATAICAIVSD